MTDDDLAARLQEVMVAAQRRYRQARGVMGAITTVPIAHGLIDELSRGLAPVLRELVDAAVERHLATNERTGT